MAKIRQDRPVAKSPSSRTFLKITMHSASGTDQSHPMYLKASTLRTDRHRVNGLPLFKFRVKTSHQIDDDFRFFECAAMTACRNDM